MVSPLQFVLPARAAGKKTGTLPTSGISIANAAPSRRARSRPLVARLFRRSNDQPFRMVTLRQVTVYMSETLTHSLVAWCSREPLQREQLKIHPDPTGAALNRSLGRQVAAEELVVLSLA